MDNVIFFDNKTHWCSVNLKLLFGKILKNHNNKNVDDNPKNHSDNLEYVVFQ